jgi:hypothetical protein
MLNIHVAIYLKAMKKIILLLKQIATRISNKVAGRQVSVIESPLPKC